MPELEFYNIIDRTYPWFPPAHVDRESIGIDLSNGNYDPDLGQQVLDQVVEGAQRSEKLGYDGVLMFEQHNTPLALMPNALTGAAWVAAKTQGIRVVAGGPILNAYSSPVRLAEEIALVDTLTGGRLIVGLPLGIGMQYHGYGAMNPVTARARFHEGVALLHRIWTEDGPFAWEGEFFHHPYVNVWPRPRTQPHPPIFIPAAGSRETIELAAKYRLTYQAILTPMPILKKNTQLFRDLALEHGYESDPKQITAVLTVHTAETDEQARRELEEYALWGRQNIIRFPFHESFPPGHVSPSSLRAMMSGGYRSTDPSLATWDDLAGPGGIIAGSPSTVRAQIEEITSEIGAGRVILGTEFTVPMWLQEKTMTLFAEEVMPFFRGADKRPVWDREPRASYSTITELIGREPHRAGEPVVRHGDDLTPLYPRPEA